MTSERDELDDRFEPRARSSLRTWKPAGEVVSVRVVWEMEEAGEGELGAEYWAETLARVEERCILDRLAIGVEGREVGSSTATDWARRSCELVRGA
jgi:hypothetical protein